MLLFAVGFTVFFAAYEKLVSKQLRTVDCKVTNGHTLKFGPNKRTKEGNLVKKKIVFYTCTLTTYRRIAGYIFKCKVLQPFKRSSLFFQFIFSNPNRKKNYIVSVYNKRLQLFSKISCLCNCTKLS